MAVGSPWHQGRRFSFAPIAARMALIAVAGCTPIDTPGPERLDAAATLFDAQSILPEASSDAAADAGTPIDSGL